MGGGGLGGMVQGGSRVEREVQGEGEGRSMERVRDFREELPANSQPFFC